jgi:DNA-3-methyladenine glycosylase
MLNIVTEQMDFPAAVLIRAVEPVGGIALMKKRRGIDEPRQFASGPGKLCEAFAIDRTLNGSDLCGSILYIRDDGDSTPAIVTRPRIGVDYAGKWKHKPWRFLIKGSEFVSKL